MDAWRAGGIADEDVRWQPEPPQVKVSDDVSFSSIMSKGGREGGFSLQGDMN